MSIRMVLKSSDGSDLFEKNMAHDFTVQLDRQINLEAYWVVALTEIDLTYKSSSKYIDDVYVYSNICEESFVGSTEKPILRKIYISKDATEAHVINKKKHYRRQGTTVFSCQFGRLCNTSLKEVFLSVEMSKSPYISDALVWQEAINQAKYLKKQHNNQLGKGFPRRYSRHRFVILKKNLPKIETKVEQIAPTVAIEERAASELKQQKNDKDPHVLQGKKAKSDGIKKAGNQNQKTVKLESSKRQQVKNRKLKTVHRARKNTLQGINLGK
ncbi:Hypothetical predicted protein [Mytilus galloprovincialis]|uniref:Uncharacterized protein n=1 Tax=Mytilus galloprovincialis TaxID=29158 RepID=A0A8B6C6V9_MYTGA|nr:Hypothetical predicted protein [Mytilus galloprovincialis]